MDLREIIEDRGLFEYREEGTGELVVDPDVVRKYLEDATFTGEKDIVLEGHLSYLAPSDLCIVLRLNPDELGDRLRSRGYPEAKTRENMEAEGIGSILVEAIELEEERLEGRSWEELPSGAGPVFEVDVTGTSKYDAAAMILALIPAYKRKILNELSQYRPGRVDWMEVVAGWY